MNIQGEIYKRNFNKASIAAREKTRSQQAGGAEMWCGAVCSAAVKRTAEGT